MDVESMMYACGNVRQLLLYHVRHWHVNKDTQSYVWYNHTTSASPKVVGHCVSVIDSAL